jgi:hypothetical protein
MAKAAAVIEGFSIRTRRRNWLRLPTVNDLLIQKSNGAFELVFWDERLRGRDNVSVNLGHTFAAVNIYDITPGATPTQCRLRLIKP